MAYSITATSLVTEALNLIGAVAPGETPNATEMTTGFGYLQRLIDGWGTQRLTILTVNRYTFTPTSNVSTYQLGPGGVTTTPALANRPQAVDDVGLVLNTNTPPVEIPLDVITDQEYAVLSMKTLTNILPIKAYYNPTMPTGTFFLWPTPTVATNDIALYIPDVLSQFADLTTSVTFAPMYARALLYNLAQDLSPAFARPLDPTVAGIATASLAALKAQNVRPGILAMDPALAPNLRGRWNILSDQWQ